MKFDRCQLLCVVFLVQLTDIMMIPLPVDLTGNESQRQVPSDNHHHEPIDRSAAPVAKVPTKRDTRHLDMSIPSNRAVLEIFYKWQLVHGGIGIIQSRYRRSARAKRAVPRSVPLTRSKHHGRRRSHYKRHEDAFIKAMHKKHKGKLINLETALRRLFRQIYFRNRGFGKTWSRYG